MKPPGELLACDPDGTTRRVANTYEAIKDGMHGATIDFVRPNDEIGFFIDDNGMLDNQPLNVPVSMMAGMALYGSAVLTAASPDDEGDTMPPPERAVLALEAMGEAWRRVTFDAARKGQDVRVYPDADRIPPPQIVQFTSDTEMFEYLFGDPDE